MPYPSVHETVLAVQSGAVDRALVPIENSLEGSVTATLDVLAAEAPDVRIALEVVRPVHHCLIAREERPLAEIVRVLSHPQATAQCTRFLRAALPRAERASSSSTAEAVQAVAGSAEPWAALGSGLAAELYGCRVLAEGVEDEPENRTRFVWLAPAGAGPATAAATKTSVVFWGPGDDSPGALVGVLRELSDRGVNLTKIESRPRRIGLGQYMFFVDLDGGTGERAVREALAGIRMRVEELRVLGSYPSA